MPNIKSAVKRVRQSAENRDENQAVKRAVATVRRNLLEAVASGNKELAQKRYVDYSSKLDKAAKKGVIKSNNANRTKSRLAQRLRAMA